jgi:hypothetical protein
MHAGQGAGTEAAAFQRTLEAMAAGRQVTRIQLYKPEGGSLGFSVVGLRSEHQGELGIYVQEIQPEGIAGTSTRHLCPGDTARGHFRY